MELNNQPIEQSAPDKKALLEFLGKEIDHIQAEFARPGWTNWAIIGGIATTAWLLYSEIELGSFDVNRILTLWLIFSLVFPFISMVFLRFLIKLPFTPYLANDRFYYSRTDSNVSLSVLLLLLFASGLLITRYLDAGSTQPYELFSYVILGIYFILFLLDFIIHEFGIFETSDGEAKSSRRRMVGVFAGLFTLTGFFIASKYLSDAGGVRVFTIFDIRVFSLAVAAFLLIRFLVSIPLRKPILEQLIRINRDLSLDRINAKTGQDQIDIALYGLRSSDILQKYVDKYLKVMEQLNKEMKQVSQKVELRKSMLKKKSKESSSKDKILEESLKNDIASHLVRIEKSLNNDLYKALLPLTFQTASLAAASKFSSAHEKNKRELLTVLIDVQSGVKASFDEVQLIRDQQGISAENTQPKILVLIDQLISRV